MNAIQEYKEQAITLFGLENKYTRCIFSLDFLVKCDILTKEKALESIENLFTDGMKEELGVIA